MEGRFLDCDAKELQRLNENAENSNTKKSTDTWRNKKKKTPEKKLKAANEHASQLLSSLTANKRILVDYEKGRN